MSVKYEIRTPLVWFDLLFSTFLEKNTKLWFLHKPYKTKQRNVSMVKAKPKYEWKITLIKALKVAGVGAASSLILWLQTFKDSDPMVGITISTILALLTAFENWMKHKNDGKK